MALRTDWGSLESLFAQRTPGRPIPRRARLPVAGFLGMQLELSNKLRGYLPDRSLKNIGEVGELLEETIKRARPTLASRRKGLPHP